MRSLAIPGDDGFVSQALLELGASRSLVFGWLPAPGNYPGGPSYEGRGLEFAAEKINIMEETFRPKSLGMYTTTTASHMSIPPLTCPRTRSIPGNQLSNRHGDSSHSHWLQGRSSGG